MPFPFSFSGAIPVNIGPVFSKTKLEGALIKALKESGASEIESLNGQIRFRGLTAYMTARPVVNIERGILSIREHDTSGEVSYKIDYERWNVLCGFLFPAFGILVWLASKDWIFLAFGLIAGLFYFLGFFWVQFRFSRWLARTVDHDFNS